MIKSVVRLLLLLGVLVGIVLPKSSVALAQLGLIDGQVLVICTGSGFQTLVLDKGGTPVGSSHAAHPCLLVHATDTASAVLPCAIRLDFAALIYDRGHNSGAGPVCAPLDARPRDPPTA